MQLQAQWSHFPPGFGDEAIPGRAPGTGALQTQSNRTTDATVEHGCRRCSDSASSPTSTDATYNAGTRGQAPEDEEALREAFEQPQFIGSMPPTPTPTLTQTPTST